MRNRIICRDSIDSDLLNKLVSDNPWLPAYLAEEGFTLQTVRVVRFHDTLTDRPWFYRKVEDIGRVSAIFDGALILREKEVWSHIHEVYGKDVEAIW